MASFESEWPGLLRGRRTPFYVGTLKGGWDGSTNRPFIDTYAKVAFAKLYDRKNRPITRGRDPQRPGWCRSMTSTASGCRGC